MHRFYCSQIKLDNITLTGPEAKHLATVLRAKPGDQIELFDGSGTLALCTITEISRKKIALAVNRRSVTPPHSTSQVILAVSIAKGCRFEWLIEKAAEMAIDEIIPVIFERTVRMPANPAIVERWQNIAISAAKQSKNLFLPTISEPLSLADAVSHCTEQYPFPRIIYGLPDADRNIVQLDPDLRATVAIIGPEGGFTDAENAFLTAHGAQPVRLTKTILRVETAALAFAAALTAMRDAAPLDFGISDIEFYI